MDSNRLIRKCVVPVMAAALLTACGEQSSTVEPYAPQFSIQGDCGHIYNPCEISGIKIVVKRKPLGPIEWPWGKPCTELPGGCFPEGLDPILGPEPNYDYEGASTPKGGEPTWQGASGASVATGSYRAEIQMEIRRIASFDRNDLCQPIIVALLDRLNSGGIWVGYNPWLDGEWVHEEQGRGTIYINKAPGFIWEADGTYDSRILRRTMTEEGIHMYFDTDVGHGSVPPEAEEAMNTMRYACGYY